MPDRRGPAAHGDPRERTEPDRPSRRRATTDDEALVHDAAALASLLSGFVLSVLEADLATR